MAGTKTKQADQTIAESQASSDIPSEPKTNRRELLKLAGAAAAGAAGRLGQGPNSAAGPPAYAPNSQEQVRDGNGVLWLSHQGSYANGWAPAQPGASFVGSPGTSLFTAVTNQQYHLTGSDGATWMLVD